MNCPLCKAPMYEHAHVREVFNATQPDVTRMFGCGTCDATVLVRRNSSIEVNR